MQNLNLSGILTDGTDAPSSKVMTATFTSSDPTVAKVVGNTIETYKVGTAVITATVDGQSTSVTIVVAAAKVESIAFDQPSVSVASGEKIQLVFS